MVLLSMWLASLGPERLCFDLFKSLKLHSSPRKKIEVIRKLNALKNFSSIHLAYFIIALFCQRPWCFIYRPLQHWPMGKHVSNYSKKLECRSKGTGMVGIRNEENRFLVEEDIAASGVDTWTRFVFPKSPVLPVTQPLENLGIHIELFHYWLQTQLLKVLVFHFQNVDVSFYSRFLCEFVSINLC